MGWTSEGNSFSDLMIRVWSRPAFLVQGQLLQQFLVSPLEGGSSLLLRVKASY